MAEDTFTVSYDGDIEATFESGDMDGLSVDVTVSLPEDVEPTETQADVVTSYAETISTFVRKNTDYSDSFADGPKIESILKHGEIRDDEIPRLLAKQIFVRGFLDKLSRFYQLYLEDEDAAVDESVEDTLLDMGNYAIMLASQLRKYSGGDN